MAQRLNGHARLDRALNLLRQGRLLRPRTAKPVIHPPYVGRPAERLMADQLFSRVVGAAPVQGNTVRLLRNGAENYPAWLEAIGAAQRFIRFENYIFRNDAIGRQFAAALAAKAQDGVAVQVLYDWMGNFLQTPNRFWHDLRAAGVEVRCFNRPRLDSPFGWLSRNHRKTVSVDGRIGFVAGLCVGDVWLDDPGRRIPAWRDTGIAIEGPAVADLDVAFAESWSHAGGEPPEPVAPPEVQPLDAPVQPGQAPNQVALRVIASKPNTMGLYRFDQLIAGMARRTLWLTDAYFVGTTAYVRTLCDAARDGVDVRLLVPGASDIPVAKALSRAGYRPLLDAGIRVFEWNGPMLHAKTAVADSRWARIGSSNLNLASWLGNWELDVAIDDPAVATEMEAMFEADLQNATEIVLDLGRIHSAMPRGRRRVRRGSPGRLAAGAVGLGSAVGAAITNHRALGPAESKVMAIGGGLLLALAVIALVMPLLLTIPVAIVAAWVAVTLLVRAWRLRTDRALASSGASSGAPPGATPGTSGA
jgi:cardiolipin synthase A/B